MKTLLDTAPFLKHLQANIIEGNGRAYNRCIFLTFHADAQHLRNFIVETFLDSELKITTALDSLEQDDRSYRKQQKNARIASCKNDHTLRDEFPIKCLHLTYSGLEKLAIQDLDVRFKQDIFFKVDMQDRYTEDMRADWNLPYQDGSIDAMFFIASDELEKIEALTASLNVRIASAMQDVCSIVQVENGKHQYDEQGYAREAFGFRDGLSKIMLWKDGKLDLEYLCDSFLKKEDEAGKSYGSFFVFQKYQQKVAVFQRKIKELAATLGISEAYIEAQVMGRFKDGTPLSLSDKACANDPNFAAAIKAFNEDKICYSEDTYGRKCPFHSHARKMNPRDKRLIKGSLTYKTDPNAKFFLHLIRRGIAYNYSEQDQGLLFMSYQRSIRSQFWQLIDWSEHPIIPGFSASTGDDALLAQAPSDPQYRWNTSWGKALPSEQTPRLFADVVKLEGGAFFYTPSTLFLEELRKNILSLQSNAIEA